MGRRQWFDTPATDSSLSAALLNDLEARKPEVEDLVLNVKDYGAVGDGFADDGPAFNAAIADLPISLGWISGTIEVPAGYKCKISTLINLDAAGGLEIVGRGGVPGYPRLIWSGGAGTGPMISMNSSYGVQLRNLLLGYDNVAFNGDLITTGWGVSNSDPRFLLMENCHLGGLSGASSAASLLKPNKLIVSVIRNCSFQDGAIGILKGASYTVSLTIEGCMFARLSSSSIKNPDSCWRIINNTFEPKASGAVSSIDHDWSFNTDGLVLTGNYFGDVTSGAGYHVKLRGRGIFIGGNYMTSPGPDAGSAHFEIDSTDGLVLAGNFMSGGARGVNFGSSVSFPTGITAIGNNISSTTPFNGQGNVTQFVEIGNTLTGSPNSQLKGRTVEINTGNLSLPVVGDGIKVAEGANAKQGVSGAMTAGAVTVSNTAITANSRLLLTRQAGGTNPGAVYESTRTAGTSFVITSTNASDTGTVAYEIFEPA